VRWRGRDHEVRTPELIGRERAAPYYGRFEWFMVQHVIQAHTFLVLHRAG
jgi:hypothetical protein